MLCVCACLFVGQLCFVVCVCECVYEFVLCVFMFGCLWFVVFACGCICVRVFVCLLFLSCVIAFACACACVLLCLLKCFVCVCVCFELFVCVCTFLYVCVCVIACAFVMCLGGCVIVCVACLCNCVCVACCVCWFICGCSSHAGDGQAIVLACVTRLLSAAALLARFVRNAWLRGPQDLAWPLQQFVTCPQCYEFAAHFLADELDRTREAQVNADTFGVAGLQRQGFRVLCRHRKAIIWCEQRRAGSAICHQLLAI